MFRYTLFLDTLLKAMTHKYIRRVPKGVTKTGKTKYMYYYAGQEGHGKGIAHDEELTAGASFAFGSGDQRYHAHITTIDGDKVTVKYDDGAKKGQEETMTKKQFQALVHGEHTESITLARDKSQKQLERFQQMKDAGAQVKESTLQKLNSHVQKLQAILDLYKEPANIDAVWMSTKEKELFEKQNKLFNFLKDEKVLSALLNTKDTDLSLAPFLLNILHATLKYKDLQKLSSKQKKDLISTAAFLANPGNITEKKLREKVYPLVKTIGELWRNIPYVEQEKTLKKIGNMDIISVDIAPNKDNKKDVIKTNIMHEAIKKSVEVVSAINPDLRKIFYGDVFLSKFEESKISDTKTQGFYVHSRIVNTQGEISDVKYAADALNMNTDNPTHLQNLVDVLDNKTLDILQAQMVQDVFTHEAAHRFSTDLLSGVYQNTDFRNELQSLKNKMTKKSLDFNKKPLHSYMLPTEAQARICNSIYSRLNSDKMLAGNDSNGSTIQINPMDINYEDLGTAFYEVSEDPEKSKLHIPLKNGKTIVLDSFQSPQVIGSLPSRYSSTNIDEFFSEMMIALTKNEYKTEPFKTDFLKMVNKYSSVFGEKR